MTTTYYYESHVTTDPVDSVLAPGFCTICELWGFRVADLVMVKSNGTEQPHTKDAFCTSRSKDFSDIVERTTALVNSLRSAGFVVRRYKIEDTIMDSKISDSLNLLTKEKV